MLCHRASIGVKHFVFADCTADELEVDVLQQRVLAPFGLLVVEHLEQFASARTWHPENVAFLDRTLQQLSH